MVDMCGRHRPRAAARRNTPWPSTWRQAGPVGVIGLERRKGNKNRGGMKSKTVATSN